MLLLLALSFYTSRIILQTLGVEDYGVYNAVGGIVAMFSFLNNSMSTSTQRFITIALGKGNKEEISQIFSTSIQIHIVIALIVLILGETIGLWFLYNKMQIPPHRIDAAFWTLQCAIGATLVMVSSVPYNAAIIAYERMSAFAYMSIIEAALKLAIIYALLIGNADKLILYAILMLGVQILIRLCYTWYCQRNFPDMKFQLTWNKPLLKEMSSLAGWGLLGNIAFILNTQGVNLLLNLYFGVIANAARGIALQVEGALKQFVTSFTMAVNPQITKSYAQEDFKYMHGLICSSARFSVYLMALITIPLLFETEYVLKLWLGEVPQYAVIFLQWSILISFIDPALSNSSLTAIIATGKIKKYQLAVTAVGGLIFFLSCLAFKLGYPPQATFIIYFFIHIILQGIRLSVLRLLTNLPMKKFIKDVILKSLSTVLLCCIIPLALTNIMETGLLRLITLTTASLLSSTSIIYFVGLSSNEQKFVLERIKLLQQKVKRKQ